MSPGLPPLHSAQYCLVDPVFDSPTRSSQVSCLFEKVGVRISSSLGLYQTHYSLLGHFGSDSGFGVIFLSAFFAASCFLYFSLLDGSLKLSKPSFCGFQATSHLCFFPGLAHHMEAVTPSSVWVTADPPLKPRQISPLGYLAG